MFKPIIALVPDTIEKAAELILKEENTTISMSDSCECYLTLVHAGSLGVGACVEKTVTVI